MSKLCAECSQKQLCDGTGLPPELYSRIMLYLTIRDHHEAISFDHLVTMFKPQIIEFSDDVAGVFDALVQLKEKCLYNV
jgi:hypothetical protein